MGEEVCLAWVSSAPDYQGLGFGSLLRGASAEPTHNSLRFMDPHGLKKPESLPLVFCCCCCLFFCFPN